MRVRIYKPTKSAMQSGRSRNAQWVIEPEIPTRRTQDPLMGWTSAEDTLSEMRNRLHFSTAEEAIYFARNNGWEYHIEDTQERKVTPRSYLDNFKIVRPEDEERQ